MPALLRRAFPVILVVACAAAVAAARKAPPPPPAPPPVETVTRRLLGEALATDEAYQALEELCDGVGARLAGSPALDRAVAWGEARLRKLGFSNVHTEAASVPVWVRGIEHAELLAPTERPLSILGLGGSVATPPEGVAADVVVVSSFEELTALGEAGVRGRIVVYDVPFTGYGETVRYRSLGASAASRLGAVAALVRSVTPVSLDTPHTGALRYEAGVAPIPGAALSIEDAQLLHRLARRGPAPRVRLTMGAKTLPDAPSANVIGEIPGREHPEEVVLLGAHLDSWDVGQGAQDDGAGVVEMMTAAHLIGQLGFAPRRTIRVVLFTNEENGLRGGKAYRQAHEAELSRHVAILESDAGAGPVIGFTVDKRPRPAPPSAAPAPAAPAGPDPAAKALADEALARLKKLAPLLDPVEAAALRPGHAGSDLEPMLAEGVLGLGVDHDTTHYWDVHHTRADTLDKIDRRVLRRNVAAVAMMAWILAETP